MKVGDLVKIKDLSSSAIGIVLKPYTDGDSINFPMWLVIFISLGYDHLCYEQE